MGKSREIRSWSELSGVEIVQFEYREYQNVLVFQITEGVNIPAGTIVMYLDTCCSSHKCGEMWVEHIDKPEWLTGMRVESVELGSVMRLPYGTRATQDHVLYLVITGLRLVGELDWERIFGGCTFEIRHSSFEGHHIPSIQTIWFDADDEVFGLKGERVKWTKPSG